MLESSEIMSLADMATWLVRGEIDTPCEIAAIAIGVEKASATSCRLLFNWAVKHIRAHRNAISMMARVLQPREEASVGESGNVDASACAPVDGSDSGLGQDVAGEVGTVVEGWRVHAETAIIRLRDRVDQLEVSRDTLTGRLDEVSIVANGLGKERTAQKIPLRSQADMPLGVSGLAGMPGDAPTTQSILKTQERVLSSLHTSLQKLSDAGSAVERRLEAAEKELLLEAEGAMQGRIRAVIADCADVVEDRLTKVTTTQTKMSKELVKLYAQMGVKDDQNAEETQEGKFDLEQCLTAMADRFPDMVWSQALVLRAEALEDSCAALREELGQVRTELEARLAPEVPSLECASVGSDRPHGNPTRSIRGVVEELLVTTSHSRRGRFNTESQENVNHGLAIAELEERLDNLHSVIQRELLCDFEVLPGSRPVSTGMVHRRSVATGGVTAPGEASGFSQKLIMMESLPLPLKRGGGAYAPSSMANSGRAPPSPTMTPSTPMSQAQEMSLVAVGLASRQANGGGPATSESDGREQRSVSAIRAMGLAGTTRELHVDCGPPAPPELAVAVGAGPQTLRGRPGIRGPPNSPKVPGSRPGSAGFPRRPRSGPEAVALKQKLCGEPFRTAAAIGVVVVAAAAAAAPATAAAAAAAAPTRGGAPGSGPGRPGSAPAGPLVVRLPAAYGATT
mmetsp:Transcript_22969/g.58503  ORF Transcript_22969/g.58503 Transcript_22969/m.58503 type:complete len:681 (-) Transcript_22969:20-2062(-)